MISFVFPRWHVLHICRPTTYPGYAHATRVVQIRLGLAVPALCWLGVAQLAAPTGWWLLYFSMLLFLAGCVFCSSIGTFIIAANPTTPPPENE